MQAMAAPRPTQLRRCLPGVRKHLARGVEQTSGLPLRAQSPALAAHTRAQHEVTMTPEKASVPAEVQTACVEPISVAQSAGATTTETQVAIATLDGAAQVWIYCLRKRAQSLSLRHKALSRLRLVIAKVCQYEKMCTYRQYQHPLRKRCRSRRPGVQLSAVDAVDGLAKLASVAASSADVDAMRGTAVRLQSAALSDTAALPFHSVLAALGAGATLGIETEASLLVLLQRLNALMAEDLKRVPSLQDAVAAAGAAARAHTQASSWPENLPAELQVAQALEAKGPEAAWQGVSTASAMSPAGGSAAARDEGAQRPQTSEPRTSSARVDTPAAAAAGPRTATADAELAQPCSSPADSVCPAAATEHDARKNDGATAGEMAKVAGALRSILQRQRDTLQMASRPRNMLLTACRQVRFCRRVTCVSSLYVHSHARLHMNVHGEDRTQQAESWDNCKMRPGFI